MTVRFARFLLCLLALLLLPLSSQAGAATLGADDPSGRAAPSRVDRLLAKRNSSGPDAHPAAGSGTATEPALAAGDTADEIPGDKWPGTGSWTESLGGADTDDVFSIYLEKGRQLAVALEAGTAFDADLYLFGPGSTTVAGLPVDGAISPTGQEAVVYYAPESGWYYVDVFATPGSEGGTYSLEIDVSNPSQSVGRRVAVLAGIEFYGEQPQPLYYCVRDVYRIRRLLIDGLHFNPNNILALTNAAATRENIEYALTVWAGQRAVDTNSQVLFYFSGHGTTGKDLYPYDEPDGLDEHLALDVATIRDDELRTWLDRLVSGNRVVWVDSCFSGGLALEAPPAHAATSVSGAQPPALAPASEASGDVPTDGAFAKDLAVPGLLVLAAAAADQSSLSSAEVGGSLFTDFLLQAYASPTGDTDQDGGVSVEEAYRWLAPRLDAYAIANHPTLNRGEGQDAQLFDGIPGDVLLDLEPALPTTTTLPTTTSTSTTLPTTTSTTTTLPATTSTTAPAPSFTDVPETHPYFAAVETLYAAGVVNGYGSGAQREFRPAADVWRWQFAKMVAGAEGLSVTESLTAHFNDLGPDDIASLEPHDLVAAATLAGIVRGYPDGSFRPYTPTRRAQVVTMVVRALQARPGAALATPPAIFTGTLGPFDEDHAPNLRVAEYNGLLAGLQGFGASWNPWANMSRGEVAQVLSNSRAAAE